MHPILNGYIAREIIARRQADGEAWRQAHTRVADSLRARFARAPAAFHPAALFRLFVDDHVRRGAAAPSTSRGAHQPGVLVVEELEAVEAARRR